MDNSQIILSLNELSNSLDQCGQYKFSEEIDNLIRIAILWNGPKLRFDHPGVNDLKRDELEPLPPQNLMEKVYQEFAGYGKPLPRSLRSVVMHPLGWNIKEFLDDVLKDYKKDSIVSMDFIKLITTSSEFVKKLDKYLKDRHSIRYTYTFEETPEVFKKILQEGESELVESLEKEFKKLKGLFVYNPNTRINKVVPALLEIKELLPPKFLAYVEAVNEWIDYQKSSELEMFEKQDMFNDNWRSKPQARDELNNYLKPKEEEEEELSVFSKYTINKLYKIANSLDEANLYKQASSVTNLMKRIAG